MLQYADIQHPHIAYAAHTLHIASTGLDVTSSVLINVEANKYQRSNHPG